MAKFERRKQFFRSLEAKSLRSRSTLTQIADSLTSICGSTPFLIFHLFFFACWIIVNTGGFPFIKPYDPFPFGLLTMIVSLEAIFLSIFVLVSQNRSSHISTLREEIELRLNSIAEEEITKILELLAEMRREMGINKEDPELARMLERTDTNYIERSIVDQLQRAKKPWVSQLIKEFPDILTYPVKKPFEMVQNITNNNHHDKNKK